MNDKTNLSVAHNLPDHLPQQKEGIFLTAGDPLGNGQFEAVPVYIADGRTMPLELAPKHLFSQVPGFQHFGKPTFESVFEEFGSFAVKTFKKATSYSTMEKLKDEAEEVQDELMNYKGTQEAREALKKEFADCLLCLVHSAKKAGFTAEELVSAMDQKSKVNQGRKWKLNANNTYSHIKDHEEEK